MLFTTSCVQWSCRTPGVVFIATTEYCDAPDKRGSPQAEGAVSIVEDALASVHEAVFAVERDREDCGL